MAQINGGFFLDAFSIVLIDILLAGDNAIVIAMAVRSLPAEQRRRGIFAGAGLAVVLRVILTFFAASLLQLEFLMVIGGLLIFWIAVKLLVQGGGEEHAGPPAANLRQAIWMILVADITMSLDNILAVAAVSKGNLVLLLAGLGLSISFVIFASGILSKLMDRFPILIWIGAAILGRVTGGMCLRDPWVVRVLAPPHEVVIAAEVIGALLVLLIGWAIKTLNNRKKVAAPGV
jgi:YjbE family integral membrane protein